MKFKNVVKVAALLAGAALFAVGCSPKENSSNNANNVKTSQKLTKVNIGLMAGPDAAPIFEARDKGYFKKQGIDAKITLFKNPHEREAASSAGKLDAVQVDYVSFTSYMRNKSQKWKLITQLTGRFGIVAPKGSKINSVADLKGKTIANTPRQVTEYYMDKTLAANKVEPDSVKLVNVPQIPQRMEMISNHQVDSAVLPATMVILAKVKGNKVINQSGKDFSLTTLAANGKLLKDKTLREHFLKAYNQGAQELNKNGKDLQAVCLNDLSLPKPVAKLAPKEFLKYRPAKTADKKTMADVLKFAKKKSFFTEKVDLNDYIIPVE